MRTDQEVAETGVEVVRTGELAVVSFRAMTSPVTLTVVRPGPDAELCLTRAAEAVRDVERTCSRFDATSALSRANAAPEQWHQVPATLAAAVSEAYRAHRETDGLFDPRVLDVLLGWGYDRSLPFVDGAVTRDPAALPAVTPAQATRTPTPWRPEIVESEGAWWIRLGHQPIDLGGIGKGLAVRWAADELVDAGEGYAVDAGGDQALGGIGPDGPRWRVGVEDPSDHAELVLVLEVTDTGCATSSTRLRRWRSGGAHVHHLVDPRTRRPGGAGLAAVTVLAPDAAWSEVWSKTLFLAGAAEIRSVAEDLGLTAAWVHEDGTVGTTTRMDPLVIWTARELEAH